MNTAGILMVAVLVALGLYFSLRSLVRTFLRYRGTRIVICPETGHPVGTEVDARHAMLTSAIGQKEIQLENCGRWPLEANCGQECLIQLDIAAPDCLVRSVLAKWYRDRKCAFCTKRLDEVHCFDHKPALQSPEGLLTVWNRVQVEDLPAVLDSYAPVCWDCYVAQTFVRDHPELVVYRPWRRTDPEAGFPKAIAKVDAPTSVRPGV